MVRSQVSKCRGERTQRRKAKIKVKGGGQAVSAPHNHLPLG